jgi:hypothetical protein
MSTKTRPTAAASSANSKPAVIRGTPLATTKGATTSTFQVALATIISGVAHVIMGILFALVILFPPDGAKASSDATEDAGITKTDLQDKPPEANLTNPDEGPNINPDLPGGFKVSKIEDAPPFKSNETSIEHVADPGSPTGTERAIMAPSELGGRGTSEILSREGTLAFGPPTLRGVGGLLNTPGSFGSRLDSRARVQALQDGGGNEISEACVARGLQWMAMHQAPDGRWSLDGFHQHATDKPGPSGRRFVCNCEGRGGKHDVAATAFGLLPFLGAGETHKGSATSKAPVYAKTVEKGLDWLISKQDKEGYFSHNMYEHGLATIAMCEAYALTADPKLKGPAQRALNAIVAAQNATGGWRYSPKSTDADTSVVGWEVMALKSGQMAGLSVPKSVWDGTTKWLEHCAGRDNSSMDTNNNYTGTYGYSGPGGGPTTTSIGLLCRQYLGWTLKNPGLLAGIDQLKKTPPGKINNMYYYYYATQVMHHVGGEAWDRWNLAMRDKLIATQDRGQDPKRAHQRGSWSPAGDQHGSSGGRVMITSLSILTLEVYYRHLPLYNRDLVKTTK